MVREEFLASAERHTGKSLAVNVSVSSLNLHSRPKQDVGSLWYLDTLAKIRKPSTAAAAVQCSRKDSTAAAVKC